MEAPRKVTIADVLAARDARAERQRRMLEKHHRPLISFTMNIPGEIKCDADIRRAFYEGRSRIAEATGAGVLEELETVAFTGCEYVCAVDADAGTLKRSMCAIEDGDALGRLFDIDVLTADGEKLSRAEGDRRRCLICGRDARVCGRSRAHTAEELNRRAHEIIRDHFDEAFALSIARPAREALVREAETTPKPGLVDLENSGAHRDMDIGDFRRSAAALEDYFAEAARIGARLRGRSAAEVFPELQSAGLCAEKTMLRATNGVNTHKGAIFSLGILCCAAGRAGEGAPREAILNEAAALGEIPFAALKQLKKEDARTGGELQYLSYGLGGVRGEAASGFKSVVTLALPALESALDAGKDMNDAGLHALLHLMAQLDDSNVLRRAGTEGAAHVRNSARRLLTTGYTKDDLRHMNDDFVRHNLSPGGCADLLAIAYFLHFINRLRE